MTENATKQKTIHEYVLARVHYYAGCDNKLNKSGD